MGQITVHLLILLTLSCLTFAEEKKEISCPQDQKHFGGSCFEFVGLHHSFYSAQNFCEQRGGHLAFIPDEDTQNFIETHLDPMQDVWIGLAPPVSTNLQNPSAAEGPLSWLDNSPVTYTKWDSSPGKDAACGHILRNSGFQWKATKDCNKSLLLICQFEPGRSIVCPGHNSTLQCGSGQVLMIDVGFYGRKRVHYCRSTLTTLTPQQCSWVDVQDTLAANCNGRQLCWISKLVDSFSEHFPQQGSYLSVDYRCKDVLTLSANTVAAVHEVITLEVKWLIDLPQENLDCKLSTGDGHVFYLHVSDLSESSVMYKYTNPNVYFMVVRCIHGDILITAQKMITIQEPITEFGVISCFAGKLSFHASNCKALYGEPFQIQMEVKTGTYVTYRIQKAEMLLSSLSVVRGNILHNVTVTPDMVQQLRPGCHKLTLYASNMVTFPETSAELQMCVLEKVSGLQASVLMERSNCEDFSQITISVSLKNGAPVLLLFFLTGGGSSFSETRKMKTREGIFHIENQIEGSVQVKVKAWNDFSSSEMDVDMITLCDKDSHFEQDNQNNIPLRFFSTLRNKHIRVVRSVDDYLIATQTGTIPNTDLQITLSINPKYNLNQQNRRYEWACTNPCKCQGNFAVEVQVLKGRCIPDPFQFNKYHFNVINTNNNKVIQTHSICITYTPINEAPSWLSLTCIRGCDPVQKNQDAQIKMECEGQTQCPQVIWYIEDPAAEKDWEEETKSCYTDAEQKPLITLNHGGTEVTVAYSYLKEAATDGVTVIMTAYEDGDYYYKKYFIKTSSSRSSSSSSSGSSEDPKTAAPETASPSASVTTGKTATTAPTDSPDTAAEITTTTSAITTVSSSTTKKTDPPAVSSIPSNAATTTSSAKTETTGNTAISTALITTTNSIIITKTATTTESSVTSDTATTAVPMLATTTATTTNIPSTSTADSAANLKCSISPNSGTILDPFTVTCSTVTPCSKCLYCFKTQDGKHLRCSESNEVKSVYLPVGDSKSNYELIIKATASNSSFTTNTTITTEVQKYTPPPDSSEGSLSAMVENAVDQLKEQGLLTGETVGQIISSVSNQLNSQNDEAEKDERQKLREQMLSIMSKVVKKSPKYPEEVQVMARGLTAVSQEGSELSTSAQEEASLIIAELSSSLLHIDLGNTEEDKKKIEAAARNIIQGAGNILQYPPNKDISDSLLLALDNTMDALLQLKVINEGPTIIQEDHISIFVKRVTPENLHTEPMNIPNCSCSSFTLPALPSDMLPSDEPVDVRVQSLDKNPFSWNERGNISGAVGSLSLTTTDGSKIPVENLSDDIEIFLPRPNGEQVNTSVLDLGNYSTTVLEIPSANDTLVLKMVPSEDALPFIVLLGYKDYPTERTHIAMTEMPLQGTTREEKYTWVLDPITLKGNTGQHFLVVRPIVGPGIKSINASLSITPITTSCRFWNESTLDWSDNGCRVGVQTTHSVTQCLCNHLTFFGSSFFVTPNLVDPSRTAELFATFAQNPVVVCFVGALFVVYLVAVIWARRKDTKDTVKVKVTALDDNNPKDEYCYLLSVSTGHRRGASTSSQVAITLMGAEGHSEPHHLTDKKKIVFERGAVDVFLLSTPFSLGDLQSIRLWHNNSGSHPDWYVGNVMVQDLQTEQKWHFLCNSWLAIDIGDCCLDRVFPVSSEMELKRFSNLFFMKTTKDFSDGHLWFSVISRPPGSNFTCVQRVSCCFSLLLCTMLTSIMFYGIPTDPSEQTLDLGHFEFTWQQFMIGVQSSLIMFPVNILIVSIFRNARPRETTCCKRKSAKPDALERLSFSQAVPIKESVTLHTVIRDITRIATSLSMTVKSNTPSKEPEFSTGQQDDINAVLSVVEDFIKQSNKTDEDHKSKNLNLDSSVQHQTAEGAANMRPGSTEEGINKKCNKSQYLHRQLCHINRELTLLGPSGFTNPHSYSQALQKVQTMKDSLEDQLFKCRNAEPCESSEKLPSPADSNDGEDGQKKWMGCCHGGLPWWFVFVGWLLVIGTSVVSAYFTMLYGLNFGKDRSVSWLVSQIVSFFQSILVIQPLKVICLAIFFALVIKKVDEEDFQNVAVEGGNQTQRDWNQRSVNRDNSLYAPPPPADVEKMKRNKVMEQKAFALIKEILTYMGFMWMLLLVAYGQRDPNAFFLNRHIRQSFSRGISHSMSLAQVFNWTSTTLLVNLFGVYPGFITDGNSKLVGNARYRQLRVQRNSCKIAKPVSGIIQDCNAPYSWEVEDKGFYDPSWNNSVGDNVSNSNPSPWKYQTQGELRAYPFWGNAELYKGGGFVAELGPDLQNASRTIDHLFRNKWLDMYTRAIFVEFTVFNANVNLLCIVTLLFETTAIGAFQFHSDLQSVHLNQTTDALHIFVMAAEIIYMLFILYYMVLQWWAIRDFLTLMRNRYFAVILSMLILVSMPVISNNAYIIGPGDQKLVPSFTKFKELIRDASFGSTLWFLKAKLMKQQKWAYFRSKWNIIELTIILLSWSALAIYIKRTLLGDRDITYYQNNKDQFANFYETAAVDSVLQYLIAFIVLLSTIKLWHLFRLNPKMNLISATLERAWGDILGFLLIIVIMLLAYSSASNVIYGWKLCHYRTFTDALMTIIRLQIGIFNYSEVLTGSPMLGALFCGSCVVFMSYIAVNLLISVILVAFSQEQIYHKPSEEEEIVDLMLKKICSLFGIKYKHKTETAGPDGSGDKDSTLKNNRKIQNNSSTDVNIIQIPDLSVNTFG